MRLLEDDVDIKQKLEAIFNSENKQVRILEANKLQQEFGVRRIKKCDWEKSLITFE